MEKRGALREGLWALGLMLKPPGPTLHKTTRTEITPLFGDARLVLDETPKAISPFGGLASFISFLGQIGFTQEVSAACPFAERASNNASPLPPAL
jgi:hypothetical protein